MVTWKEKYMTEPVTDKFHPEVGGKMYQKLKAVFLKYCDQKDWKNPFTAYVPTYKEAILLRRAIIVMHAYKPKNVKKVEVPVKHREGFVWMRGTAYLVESKGYQAW